MDCFNLDICRMPKSNFHNWKLKRGITGIIQAVPLQSNIFSFVILCSTIFSIIEAISKYASLPRILSHAISKRKSSVLVSSRQQPLL